MHLNNTKVSRHNDPGLLKVEFVGSDDVVVVSMKGEGVNDLSNMQAVARARGVLSELVENDRKSGGLSSTTGTD